MPRARGSKNRRTAHVAAALDALERSGDLQPREWLLTLQRIAFDHSEDAQARISAVRALAAYRWGLPRAHLDIEHGVAPSAAELLLAIARSDEHRVAQEQLEAWRARALPAVSER